MLFPREDRLHLIDLLPLGFLDLVAEPDDLWIAQIRLPAHQDSARVMRNHRPQKSGITDRPLRPNEGERAGENDEEATNNAKLAAFDGNICHIATIISTTIGATIISVM